MYPDLDFQVPEQVIKVPKLSFRRCYVKNLCILPIEHQTAEQLVEVPTVVSFSSLQRTAEQGIDIPEVVEEHPASNGSVWKLEERLLDVRRWDLQERTKGWIGQILQSDPLANPGHGPHMWARGGLDRERLEPSRVDILRWLIFLHLFRLALGQ